MTAQQTPDAAPAPQVSLLPILAVNFVGSLGFSIVLPFLIFLVTRWGGNALVYGLAGATYSGFQLIGAPVLGRWSDRYGRRRILLLSQLGTLLSWCLFLVAFLVPERALAEVDSAVVGRFTLTLPLLLVFVARATDGLTGGNISVANAYLADVTDEQDRNESFGKMAVSSNLGFILGPALAGLLGATVWGEVLPVAAAAAISLAATLIILTRLPESHPCALTSDPERGTVRKVFGQEQKDCFRTYGEETPSWREIVRIAGVRRLLLIYFLVMLGFNLFYITFPVYAVEILDWSVTQTGAFFAVLSAFMVVVQGPVLARAAKRFSDGALVVFGAFVLASSFLFFLGRTGALLYTGALLMALGNGLMWPSMLSLLSKAAGEARQGAVQGFAGSLGAIASIVGLVVGGLLFHELRGWTFALGAGTIGVVSWLALPYCLRDSTVSGSGSNS